MMGSEIKVLLLWLTGVAIFATLALTTMCGTDKEQAAWLGAMFSLIGAAITGCVCLIDYLRLRSEGRMSP